MSRLLAPVPRAGQAAQSTPTSPAGHSLHRHQARQAVLPQPCIADVPTEVPVGLSHLQRVKQSQRAGKQGRKTHPTLTCMALLYSTPFFLVHTPCHRAASCKAAGSLITPWRSTSTCCCSRGSTLIPPDTGPPPGCPHLLTRIPPPRSEVLLQPHSFKEKHRGSWGSSSCCFSLQFLP